MGWLVRLPYPKALGLIEKNLPKRVDERAIEEDSLDVGLRPVCICTCTPKCEHAYTRASTPQTFICLRKNQGGKDLNPSSVAFCVQPLAMADVRGLVE